MFEYPLHRFRNEIWHDLIGLMTRSSRKCCSNHVVDDVRGQDAPSKPHKHHTLMCMIRIVPSPCTVLVRMRYDKYDTLVYHRIIVSVCTEQHSIVPYVLFYRTSNLFLVDWSTAECSSIFKSFKRSLRMFCMKKSLKNLIR